MINLAGRDILHSWGKFAFTGLGLGLLIGVTLSLPLLTAICNLRSLQS